MKVLIRGLSLLAIPCECSFFREPVAFLRPWPEYGKSPIQTPVIAPLHWCPGGRLTRGSKVPDREAKAVAVQGHSEGHQEGRLRGPGRLFQNLSVRQAPVLAEVLGAPLKGLIVLKQLVFY